MFKNVLLPVDLNQESSWTKALGVAEKLAAKDNATLHVVAVVPAFNMAVVGTYFPENFEKDALRAAQENLNTFLQEQCSREDVTVNGHVAHGTIYEEILRVADELNCDVIVMASHRPALQDYLIGPNAARVVRHAKQSVFVVRG